MRAQAASVPTPNTVFELALLAEQILSRIQESFSPSAWTTLKLVSLQVSPAESAAQGWLLIARIYQAATALYCLLSLRHLLVAHSVDATVYTQARLLRALLGEGLASPRMKRFLVWPLVVLGVVSFSLSLSRDPDTTVKEEGMAGGVDGNCPGGDEDGGGKDGAEEERNDGERDEAREFVRMQLAELGWHMGSCVPLTAKAVLERFWASGKTDWDACFATPYVFTGQIAVDTRRLYGC